MKERFKILLIILLLCFYGTACRQETSQEESVEEDTLPSDDLEVTEVDHSQWQGVWEREGAIDPASIAINNITNSEFEFHLNAYDGINTSELTGTATIDDNMALFVTSDAKDTCRLSFVMQDSLLIINQMDDYCSGATEIDFSGEYFHERFFKEKTMDEDAAARKEKESGN